MVNLGAALSRSQLAPRSPTLGLAEQVRQVIRAKQGGKRLATVEADDIPLGAVAAPANRRNNGLLAVTLPTLASLGPLPTHPIVQLEVGCDCKACRDELQP